MIIIYDKLCGDNDGGGGGGVRGSKECCGAAGCCGCGIRTFQNILIKYIIEICIF